MNKKQKRIRTSRIGNGARVYRTLGHKTQFGREYISGSKKKGDLVLGEDLNYNLTPKEGQKAEIISRGYNRLLRAFTPYRSSLNYNVNEDK